MAKKWITGYEGVYEIQDDGTVHTHKTGPGASALTLKHCKNSKGYAQVMLSGKPKRVHRLVAEAFIPNPEGFPQVNHIDGDKFNNHVSNLEWCNNQYNCEQALAKTYKLRHKDGSIVEIFNMNKWCREQGLCSSSMNRMIMGGRKSYRGWSNYAS